MINVLFVIDKFIDKNTKQWTSDLTPKFLTCESTQLFKAQFLYTDEIIDINKALPEYLTNNPVDVIIFSYFAGHASFNPLVCTLEWIKNTYPNIKFVFSWWDVLFHQYIRDCILEVDHLADTHLTFDGSSLSKLNLSNKGKTFPCPQVDEWYYPDEQTIDVSFMGRVNTYADRIMYLNYLGSNGCQVNVGGGRVEDNLSDEEYARNIRQSKINLNFSLSATGNTYQYKERVYEALACKNLLLEMDNPLTPQYLTPRKDYIPFSTPFGLLDTIKYYLEHEDERLKIAEHGYKTYHKKYHSKFLWEYIVNVIS